MVEMKPGADLQPTIISHSILVQTKLQSQIAKGLEVAKINGPDERRGHIYGYGSFHKVN